MKIPRRSGENECKRPVLTRNVIIMFSYLCSASEPNGNETTPEGNNNNNEDAVDASPASSPLRAPSWSQELSQENLELGKKGRVTDPATGNRLSLAEAVDAGLIDPKDGALIAADGERVPLDEAARRGLIEPQLAELLTANCGVFGGGKQLRRLEAIERGRFDLDRGSFVDPQTGESVSVEDAIRQGRVLQEKVRTGEDEELQAQEQKQAQHQQQL